MVILNLTQHKPTAEQLAVGVIEPRELEKAALVEALTFDEIPSRAEIFARAEVLAELCARYDLDGSDDSDGPYPTRAMIGGAPYLMSAIEASLKSRGITPLYAFTVRDTVEVVKDGATIKTAVFRHAGWVSCD